ncbi:MAG: cysteine--tRNA ligase [Campylobacterota bacterium]|nr:cysteine--tRNA ligase [Campylobacterota bacterium]
MYIFDSVTKTKRLFEPQDPSRVTLYVCGPTVYDDAHLGHAKSALVFDLLSRVIRANNYTLIFAKNITDIDDKIIKKSSESGISIQELTDTYTQAYHRDMDALGVVRPDLEPKATESLEAMTQMIQDLIDAKHAYATDEGDVYFNTKSDASYLSISGRKQDEDETISRVESSTCKINSTDFALWKGVHDESIAFESPFGKGRPGWHLECSAMIEKHLAQDGEFAIDIHGGGADLLFPHHENEAAQTRCSSNHELAKYWMHNGFVNIDGEKMSKSLGNSFFIKDALKNYSGEVLRYYLLSTHYRSNFNFNEDDLIASKKRLDKLYRLKKRLFGLKVTEIKTDFQDKIMEALNDDMNVSISYALIDEMIQNANEGLDANAKNKVLKRESVANLAFLQNLLGFGTQNPFEYFQFGIDEATKTAIDNLIIQRSEAKKAKDFERSDALRDEILAFGISIMDTAEGTFWERLDK